MKKILSLLLVLALCFGLGACVVNGTNNTGVTPSVSTTPTATAQTQPTPSYTLEDVIIAKAVEMAKLTGLRTNSDFLKLYTPHDEIITLAQSFSEAGEKNPVEAFGFCIGNVDMTDLIKSLTSSCLGDLGLACSSVLMHNTHIYLHEPLSEAVAICLKYSEDCYILVTFNPVQDQITFVQAYALFPKVVDEILSTYFCDVETISADQIARACTVAAEASCRYPGNDVVVDAKYYAELAKNAISRIPIEKAKEMLTETVMPYFEHLSPNFSHVAQEVYVYQFSDKAQQLIAEEYHVEKIGNSELRELACRELLTMTPKRMAEMYGLELVAMNSVLQGVAQPVWVDGAPEQQGLPVLVVFVYSDGSACLVCIYGNEYGLLQYTFASMPELPSNWNDYNLNETGLVRMN